MKPKVLRDLRNYWTPDRKHRLMVILSSVIEDLTDQQVDELNGIVWWPLNLLRLIDADKLENAFTAEGMEYHRLTNAQAAILKLSGFRGGTEDHSPPSSVIAL